MVRKWFNSQKTRMEILIEENGTKLHVRNANFGHAVQLLKKYIHDSEELRRAINRLFKPGHLFLDLPNGGSLEITRVSKLVWE